ncbi:MULTISPECIES: hypothetical protein [Leisingera]|jgi:hypothetical protein|uniref:hypothetical protein n=1 Tax=Leisingera TaxID=191028 RepID=UPI000A90D3CE|nr:MULTISPECIES: hypothetical protein [Leisingera]QDI74416.1 hypothetical protein R2C4_01065 [Leisingera aquaemixtae]
MTETPDLANPTRPAGFRLPLGRRGLVIAAMAIIGAGTALNWGWLTAIGAAPLILSLAPCAVMCATGYCVMCKSKGCDAQKTPTSEPVDTKDGISTRERN